MTPCTCRGWRNYGTQALTFDPSCNVIYGENAQGKTNLLEAIVYLSCGKSPRAHGDKELIGFDMQEAALLGNIFSRQPGICDGHTPLPRKAAENDR